MGLLSNTLKRAGRKIKTRLMDQMGSQLVSRIADTSADAPSAYYKPKRDVYRKMQEEEAEAEAAEKKDATPPPAG